MPCYPVHLAIRERDWNLEPQNYNSSVITAFTRNVIFLTRLCVTRIVFRVRFILGVLVPRVARSPRSLGLTSGPIRLSGYEIVWAHELLRSRSFAKAKKIARAKEKNDKTSGLLYHWPNSSVAFRFLNPISEYLNLSKEMGRMVTRRRKS